MCLVWCHRRRCGPVRSRFSCDCRRRITSQTSPTNKPRCINDVDVCDGTPDCRDGSDEVDCICSDNQFQCSTCKLGQARCLDPFHCLPDVYVGDGEQHCWEKDEEK